jgi:regulation of enolase protein 1 (concanavalin A-like superfamily)
LVDDSSVVSNPLSDWAIQPYPIEGPLTIRLTAEPGPHAKVHIAYRNGNKWVIFREITGWTFDSTIDIGVMACSPGQGSGVDVEFWDVVAQDYSELAVEKGIEVGTLNPTFHFGGSDKVGNW